MSFFEDIVIQGTQYQGMDLVGYSFGIALLLLPIVFALVFFDIFIRVCWKVYKERRNSKRTGEEE